MWVDWQDIPLTADWWKEICTGIEAADNFIFIISPESVRSKVCFDEIQRAVVHHKRIVPVLLTCGSIIAPTLRNQCAMSSRPIRSNELAFRQV